MLEAMDGWVNGGGMLSWSEKGWPTQLREVHGILIG